MRVKSRKCILVGIIYLNNTYKIFIFDVELTIICYVFISWKFILLYPVGIVRSRTKATEFFFSFRSIVCIKAR